MAMPPNVSRTLFVLQKQFLRQLGQLLRLCKCKKKRSASGASPPLTHWPGAPPFDPLRALPPDLCYRFAHRQTLILNPSVVRESFMPHATWPDFDQYHACISFRDIRRVCLSICVYCVIQWRDQSWTRDVELQRTCVRRGTLTVHRDSVSVDLISPLKALINAVSQLQSSTLNTVNVLYRSSKPMYWMAASPRGLASWTQAF